MTPEATFSNHPTPTRRHSHSFSIWPSSTLSGPPCTWPEASKGTTDDVKCVTEIQKLANFNWCLCCTTHRKASLIPKFSRGWYPGSPLKRGRGRRQVASWLSRDRWMPLYLTNVLHLHFDSNVIFDKVRSIFYSSCLCFSWLSSGYISLYLASFFLFLIFSFYDSTYTSPYVKMFACLVCFMIN